MASALRIDLELEALDRVQRSAADRSRWALAVRAAGRRSALLGLRAPGIILACELCRHLTGHAPTCLRAGEQEGG